MTYYAIRQETPKPYWTKSGKATELYNYYTVAKFEDGEVQPANVYDVEIHRATGAAKCNCPAALYHGRQGAQDKHVKMVLKWIAAGKPVPAIVEPN